MQPLISIVSPVYQAERIVPKLVKELIVTLDAIPYTFEIILVEDGSTDNSWKSIEAESGKDPRVKGVRLSRNFGQHYAIAAGLDNVSGEWVIVMDCDLQDQPSEIPKMVEKAKQGFDIVLGRRMNRKEAGINRWFARLFYWMLGYLTGKKQDPAVGNFGIYRQNVIRAIQSTGESIRYFPAMVNWVGFRRGFLDVEHGERDSGHSNYNFKRLANLAIDILMANSEKPIRMIVKMGVFISFLSLLASLIVLVRYFTGSIEVAGYTSLILSVWLLGGIIILLLGILGLYIGKVFQQVKGRPVYVISDKTGF